MAKPLEPKIRVLIVDDHPVTRDGLRAALSTANEIEIVGEASNGEEGVEAVRTLQPDAVCMDVRMPGMNGLEATAQIRQLRPATKVILFTVEESRAAVAEAIRAGVSGYLLKGSSAGEILHAIKQGLKGNLVIHPTLNRAFVEEAEYLTRRPDSPLSPRELQVLQMVANGATTKEVAHSLGISPHTVKSHLERTYEKLGVNDRAEAVAKAIRQGLVA